MRKDDGQQKPLMMRIARRGQAVSVLVTVLSFAASFVLALAGWSRILLWTGIGDWAVDGTDSIAFGIAVEVILMGVPVLIGYWAAKASYVNTRWREVTWDGSRCVQCDYDLTGNTSGRCPECGWKIPVRSEDESA